MLQTRKSCAALGLICEAEISSLPKFLGLLEELARLQSRTHYQTAGRQLLG